MISQIKFFMTSHFGTLLPLPIYKMPQERYEEDIKQNLISLRSINHDNFLGDFCRKGVKT